MIVICGMLFIATDLAPLFTQVGTSSGLIDAGSGSVSALSGGGEVLAWIVIKILSVFGLA